MSQPRPAIGLDGIGQASEGDLGAPSAKRREAALDGLVPPVPAETLAEVRRLLREDVNANVRRAAAEALGRLGGAGAVGALVVAVRDRNEEIFIRLAAARAIGALRDEAGVAALGETLEEDAEPRLKIACVEALGAVATADARAAIRSRLAGLNPPVVRARAIVVLQSSGAVTDEDFEAVSRLVQGEKDAGVVKAALRVLAESWPDRAGAQLIPFLSADDAALRRRAAESLAEVRPSDPVTRALTSAALTDDEPAVREAAASATARVGQPPVIVEALIDLGRSRRVARNTVDEKALAKLTEQIAAGADGVRGPAADAILEACLDADEAITGTLVLVLVYCCGRDLSIAGAEVNRFAKGRPDLEHRLTPVRVALGGQKALDPILRQLSEDLETYFQKPVHKLNEETIAGWRAAARRAQFAFAARVAMSLVVFAVGIGLVVVSVVLWTTGEKDVTTIWGAGASLVSGIAAMLAVTYSGPLRDVRQSMRDLGASTAAFIGFVHRISQISHTFTGLYTRQMLSFDEVAQASRLIRDATRDTVELLGESVPAPTAGTGEDPADRAAGRAPSSPGGTAPEPRDVRE